MTYASTSSQVTPEDAANELLKRRRARRHLLRFTLYTKPDYEATIYHYRVADVLTRVVAGLTPDPTLIGKPAPADNPYRVLDPTAPKRVIITQPPQTGKSELASRRLPAYAFGCNPDLRIIATSYGDGLATLMNRDVQQIIDSEAYARLFPNTSLNSSNVRTAAYGQPLRNSDIFEIVNRKGKYKSAGIGGTITGFSGDLGIIDDPIKNRDDAESDVYRANLRHWFTTTFRSRLVANPNSAIIIMHTRWHSEDLIGWLLELEKDNKDADKWLLINLPAELDVIPDKVKEPKQYEAYITYDKRKLGDLLWASRLPKATLNGIRAYDPDDYEALYQQRPIKPGGEMFPREKWVIIDKDVFNALVNSGYEGMTFVRYWDKAGTKDGGAYTAGVLMCYDPFRRFGVNYIVVDVARCQREAFEREQLIKLTAQLDTRYNSEEQTVTTWLEQEGGSGGKESAQNTAINTLAGFAVEYETATGDKAVRAKPFSSQQKAGNVGLVLGLWNDDYIAELAAFPQGKYKDQTDGSSGGFNKLALGWVNEFVVVVDEPVNISPY
jgi:predicted phage terminase large subunit-like protein